VKTILVVDDEFGLAEALSALLVDDGYLVHTAVNGRQGMEKLAQVKPDLVLIDYMMPVMNGADMLRAMRGDPAYRDIPAVLMSGIPESMLKGECDGYNAFLRKPFDGVALLELVLKLAGKAE
jgi:CheY-like chemotaxis protein